MSFFGWGKKTNNNDSSSLNNEESPTTNYNTFLKYNKYGESSEENLTINKDEVEFEQMANSSSTQLLIPLNSNSLNNKKRKKSLLTHKYCEKILTFWIREFVLSSSQNLKDNQDIFDIFKHYSSIYTLTISYTLKYKRLNNIRWCDTTKSSIIKLLNTNKTFIVHQDKFRNGRNKKIINFKELNKYHFVRLNENIPNIYQCNGILYEFEIYQKYLDFKKYDLNIFDRKMSALCGAHKIGIMAEYSKGFKKEKYFIGIYSFFNYSFKNKYNKHKQNGNMYKVDINGNKQLIKSQIALRKHEIIEMKIDWISMKLIFNRISLKKGVGLGKGGGKYDDSGDIIIDLKSFDYNKKFMHWYPCCDICVNDIDSFMWNDNKDKDFISYTINASYLL